MKRLAAAIRRARAVAASLAAGLILVGVSCGGRESLPNVLILVMDTTRADRCSFLGYDRSTTPRLEEFAKDAVAFRDAWSPANWTGPAHASLFTGLLPEHHGFYDGNRRFLLPEADTMARRLAARGYSTACYSNNGLLSSEFGLLSGFRHVVPLYSRTDVPYPWARTTHDEAADFAIDEARAGRPFFVFINDMEPHLPYEPPAEIARKFVRGDPAPDEIDLLRHYAYPRALSYDIGAEGLTDLERSVLSDLYDAEIATLDAEIGRLLDRLRFAGLLDNTLVVILGDHGENLGEHHLMEHAVGLHRTLCHVPLLVRLPGAFDGGRVVDDVVRLVDIYPTVIEACGAAVPPGLDGESLARNLPGRVALAMQPDWNRARKRVRELFSVTDVPRAFHAARSVYDGRHHLIAYADGSNELYDVEHDPAESKDVAAANPTVVARLRELLLPPAPEGDVAPTPK